MPNKPNNLGFMIIFTVVFMMAGYGIALFVVSLVTHTEYTRLLTSPYTITTFIFLTGLEIYNIIKKSKENDEDK